jgi:hypothetical protein
VHGDIEQLVLRDLVICLHGVDLGEWLDLTDDATGERRKSYRAHQCT